MYGGGRMKTHRDGRSCSTVRDHVKSGDNSVILNHRFVLADSRIGTFT